MLDPVMWSSSNRKMCFSGKTKLSPSSSSHDVSSCHWEWPSYSIYVFWDVGRIEANKFSPRNGRKIRKEVTLSRTCHVFHVFILPDQLWHSNLCRPALEEFAMIKNTFCLVKWCMHAFSLRGHFNKLLIIE